MNIFEGKNYYQILKISPNADPVAINRAYRQALALYDEDSLATYALFSDDQRMRVLQSIYEAYDTLSDESKRAEYNQMLIDTGQVDADVFSTKDNKHMFGLSGDKGESKLYSLRDWVTKRSGENEVKTIKDEILSKERVSGSDLKRLREALGIEPEELYEITRISGSMLGLLEADRFEDLPAEVFLKNFLRSYAEILQLDPRSVIDGYFKCMVIKP